MANIKTYLNNIKTAVFGSEVRDSIHDAIQQCYDDASAKDNANMEVKMARGEYENLGKRLDSHSSQIKDIENKKADKTNVSYNFNNLQSQINNLVLGAVGDGNNAEIIQARTNYYGIEFDTLKSLNDYIEKSIDNIIDKKFKMKWSVGQLSDGILWPASNKYRINTVDVEYADEDLLFSLTDYTKYKYGFQTFDSNGNFKKDSGWQYIDRFIPKGTYFKVSIAPISEQNEITNVLNNELFDNLSIIPFNSIKSIAEQNKYILKKDINPSDYYQIGRTKLNLNATVTEDYIATGSEYKNRILPKYPYFIDIKGISDFIIVNNTGFSFAIDYIKDNIVVANKSWSNNSYEIVKDVDYDYLLIQFKKTDDSDFISSSEFNFNDFKIIYKNIDLFEVTYSYNMIKQSDILTYKEKIEVCEEKIEVCEEKIEAIQNSSQNSSQNIPKNIIYGQSNSIGYRMTNDNSIKITKNFSNEKTIDLLLSFNPNTLNNQADDTILLSNNNYELIFKKGINAGKIVLNYLDGGTIKNITSKVDTNIKLTKEIEVESYGASQGIATDGDYIYTSNNRLDKNTYNIHKRKLDGTLVKGITLPSGFQHPCGLCVVGNILYVPANNYPTDDTINRIYRIDTSNMNIIDYKDVYSAHGVSSIAFKNNLFYISDWAITGNTNIITCDRNLNILDSKEFNCRKVQGLDLYKDKLIVAETENEQFIVFDYDTKEIIETYNFIQTIEGEDICITDEGTILHEDVNTIREYRLLSDKNVEFKLRITIETVDNNTTIKFYIDNILQGQDTITGWSPTSNTICINGNDSDLNKGNFNLKGFGIASTLLTDYYMKDYSKYDNLWLNCYSINPNDIHNNTIQTSGTIINQVF